MTDLILPISHVRGRGSAVVITPESALALVELAKLAKQPQLGDRTAPPTTEYASPAVQLRAHLYDIMRDNTAAGEYVENRHIHQFAEEIAKCLEAGTVPLPKGAST